MMTGKSGISDKNTELTNSYQISKFISILIGLQGISMSIVNYHEHNIPLMILSAAYGVLMLFSYIVIHFTKKLNFFYFSAIFVCLVLECNFLYKGGSEGFGMVWLLVIPVFAIFILRFKHYIVFNSIIYLVAAVAYWSPIRQFCYPVTKTFLLRYPWVYLLLFAFCAYIKYKIENYETLLKEQKKVLESEIKLASELQKGYLPQSVDINSDWELAFKNKPMAGVSGDFYDIYTTDKKLDGFGLFDISGHGISSGLVSLLIKSIIHHEFYVKSSAGLNDKMNIINRRFIKEKGNVQNYLTGILIKINENQLELVNSGHPYPIIYRKKTNSFELLVRDSKSVGVIGLDGMPATYVSQFVTLESGDEIILYSDGITEAKNKQKKDYGIDRFISVLGSTVEKSASDQIDAVFQDVASYISGDAEDDETVIVLRRA